MLEYMRFIGGVGFRLVWWHGILLCVPPEVKNMNDLIKRQLKQSMKDGLWMYLLVATPILSLASLFIVYAFNNLNIVYFLFLLAITSASYANLYYHLWGINEK